MYIIAGLFNIILARYKELEIDLEKIFARHNTDMSVLNNPVAKIEAGILGEYLENVVLIKGDNRTGLKSGFRIPFNLIPAFFNLYSKSRTVRDLFCELDKFGSTSNDIITHCIRVENNLVYYDIAIDEAFAGQYLIAARQFREMQYGMALQYAYSYTGRFIQPMEAYSVYGKEGKTDGLEEYLNCPVRFNQQKQVLVFRESILELPVVTVGKEYLELFEDAMSHIEYRYNANRLSNVVRRYLMHSLSTSGLGLKPVAERFHMSERNIQRKLKAEGRSYQQILDDLRKELARKYLVANIPLTEIAFLLGFETQSAFNKFFQKHFHTTPKRLLDDTLRF